MTTAETVEGVVEARNERGVKVAGEWRNLSKFRPLDLPAVSSTVRLGVDSKGFISKLEVVSQPECRTAGVERDERIARLAVLKAAANFLGQLSQTREEVRSDHVLVLADRWLAWVNQ